MEQQLIDDLTTLVDAVLTEDTRPPEPLVITELGADITVMPVPFTPGRGQK